jgi:deoxyribodipyrimidine photolyase-related protein
MRAAFSLAQEVARVLGSGQILQQAVPKQPLRGAALMTTLRLILGDQLNHRHSWFASVDETVMYCLFEMRQETDYVVHHIQKVTAFFLAMRAFGAELTDAGHRVYYLRLDDEQNSQGLEENLIRTIKRHKADRFEYQLPDEYRLDRQLDDICARLPIATGAVDTEHFFTKRAAVDTFFGAKSYRLETFYRHMRRTHDILMDDGKPAGGSWNYDKFNRKKLPATTTPPEPLLFASDAAHLTAMLAKEDVKTIGTMASDTCTWPVTRDESIALLDYFVAACLPHFGQYQDAMTTRSWSLFHARLSFSLNTKLISPSEVIEKAVTRWQQRPDEIIIAQIEGFVRQILGWREYLRGVYWARMPQYRTLNYLEHRNPLPSWYWSGETKMACLHHAISQSLQYAYAHHIQRLMVTGNFALLAGVHPDAVDEWYLGIYIDAIEWVEMPNTRGMSQFADGGVVGTKPYCSSANYIDKMSDYCSTCQYLKKERMGIRACPFNTLYWHFYDRHRDKLANNPRIGMAYRTWDKMERSRQKGILAQAETYLADIESL